MSSETAPWIACQVCGHKDHSYRNHLSKESAPEFVHSSVLRLKALEKDGGDIEPLVRDMSSLVEAEDGDRKAWALWLLKLLQELEEASEAPEVAAQIEGFLLEGYS